MNAYHPILGIVPAVRLYAANERLHLLEGTRADHEPTRLAGDLERLRAEVDRRSESVAALHAEGPSAETVYDRWAPEELRDAAGHWVAIAREQAYRQELATWVQQAPDWWVRGMHAEVGDPLHWIGALRVNLARDEAMYEGQRRNLEQARIVASDPDPDRARVGRESVAYYRTEIGKVERELLPRRADANEWVRSPDVARAARAAGHGAAGARARTGARAWRHRGLA